MQGYSTVEMLNTNVLGDQQMAPGVGRGGFYSSAGSGGGGGGFYSSGGSQKFDGGSSMAAYQELGYSTQNVGGIQIPAAPSSL